MNVSNFPILHILIVSKYMFFSRKSRKPRENVPVVETGTPVEMARALKLISC